ncbi:hypothetical protein BU23DRAFT_268626 [Bimuria novae-zelandiae CBS 107.79]|uniref:Uncharacterized protein n=1 Tax=Bimuria novae-zelandiae CBS 107.79 TaxID=1447943 RepID=A0A6A5USQ6_9PLEO|nr:hypothetical protein BU23DRAFT_268626 [Bimuria novae-zelandiae CBS 107.79]
MTASFFDFSYELRHPVVIVIPELPAIEKCAGPAVVEIDVSCVSPPQSERVGDFVALRALGGRYIPVLVRPLYITGNRAIRTPSSSFRKLGYRQRSMVTKIAKNVVAKNALTMNLSGSIELMLCINESWSGPVSRSDTAPSPSERDSVSPFEKCGDNDRNRDEKDR